MEAAEFPDIAVPWQRGLDGSTRNLPTFLVTFHESHIHFIYIISLYLDYIYSISRFFYNITYYYYYYHYYFHHHHYPYIYIYIYITWIIHPLFFPSPAGVQELTMNNQDLKVVISVVTCLLFVQADDATTPCGDDWRRGRLFCWKDVFSVA